MMRVTNWQRWQRTKIAVAVTAFVIALGCIGGLEAEGTEPIPSASGFLFWISVTGLLTYNIITNTNKGRK